MSFIASFLILLLYGTAYAQDIVEPGMVGSLAACGGLKLSTLLTGNIAIVKKA
ncbi:MAG: hypothetical protein IPM97_12470 [Bdellovibrionaceae bacterium]|nr:hypothetical protein [Pseudobdellovibrionaceae bacterium]